MEILIYGSLYLHPEQKDFWNINFKHVVHRGLIDTLCRDHFAELEVSFHVSDPDMKGDVLSQLETVNSMPLNICKTIWQPN